MKVGRGKSRFAMCISLMMVWGAIPVQGQGIQTHFSTPVQEEPLESPLYESVLTQGIEKLDPTGSSESAVSAGQPVRDVNLTSGNGFQAYAGYGSRQFRSPSTPMNRDTTPVASDRNSLPLERTGISEGSNSPMYVVVLASAIEKLEPAQVLTKPVQKPQDAAKSKPAWPARQIYNCIGPTYSGYTTCSGVNTCNGFVTCIAQTCYGGTTCNGISTCNGTSTCGGWPTCDGSTTCNGSTTCDGTSTCNGANTCIRITCVSGGATCNGIDTCSGAWTCGGYPTCDGTATCNGGGTCNGSNTCWTQTCSGGSTCDRTSNTCEGSMTCGGRATCKSTSTCNDGQTCDGNNTCNRTATCVSITCYSSGNTCQVGSTCQGASSTCGGYPTCQGSPTCGGTTCDGSSTCGRYATCDGTNTCQGTSTCSGASTCIIQTCDSGSTCEGGPTCNGTMTCGGSLTCESSTTCHDGQTCDGTSTCDGSSTCVSITCTSTGSTCGNVSTCDGENTCGGNPTCDGTGTCTGGNTCAGASTCLTQTCSGGSTCNNTSTCDYSPTCGGSVSCSGSVTCDNSTTCDGSTTCNAIATCARVTCESGGTTCDAITTCDGNDTCGGSPTCEGTNTCLYEVTCNGSSTCVGGPTCQGGNTCEGGDTCDSNSPTCGGYATCDPSPTCEGVETCDGTATCKVVTCSGESTCDGGNTCEGSETCEGTPTCSSTCEGSNTCDGTSTCDGSTCGDITCDGSTECGGGGGGGGGPRPIASIAGYVYDAENIEAIEGANVSARVSGVNIKNSQTDWLGFYNIFGLSTGNYTVVASADGYADEKRLDVPVSSGKTQWLNFALGVIEIDADSNRDGKIDHTDDQVEENSPGRIIMFNWDDDNNNGIVDCNEEPVSQNPNDPDSQDENDLVEVNLSVKPGAVGDVAISTPPTDILVYDSPTKNNWINDDISTSLLPMSIWVEAYSITYGTKDYTITATHDSYSDKVKFTVAPFLILPNTAPIEKVYISDFDSSFVSELSGYIGSNKIVPLSHYSYSDDVWVQDEVEIGYFKTPPDTNTPIVWDLPRNDLLDNWPESELLGPDFCIVKEGVGSHTGNYGGNLEVTPPVTVDGTEYKFGRVLVGSNMDSSLTDFIVAQGVQIPVIQLDTSWLFVGHVDEVFCFVPWGDSFKVLVADTISARNLLNSMYVTDTGTATSGGVSTLTDNSKSWTSNEWQEGIVAITSGTGSFPPQARQVIGNNATTLIVARDWDIEPDSTSMYQLMSRSQFLTLFTEGNEVLGVVESSSSDTLTDTTKSWTYNEWADGYVRIVGGTGRGQTKQIISNTPTQITIDSDWSIGLDDSSAYVLVNDSKWWRDENRNPTIPSLVSVRELLSTDIYWGGMSFIDWNTDILNGCQKHINDMRTVLRSALGWTDDSNFINIPTIFYQTGSGALAQVPNMVNCLVDGTKVIMADPFGPRSGGVDIFRNDVIGKLNGLNSIFIDDWDTYHSMCGEVHCGTNAKRTPPSEKWWE